MEYSFQNSGVSSVQAMTEVQYRSTWKSMAVYLVLFAMVLIYYIRTFILGAVDPLLYVFFVAILCFAIWWVLNPYLRVRKLVREETAFYNGRRPANTILFGEDIQIRREDFSRSWDYSHIRKVHSWKYSYCLIMENNVALSFDRNDFTQGSFEDFKQFLRTKRPDLKIPE